MSFLDYLDKKAKEKRTIDKIDERINTKQSTKQIQKKEKIEVTEQTYNELKSNGIDVSNYSIKESFSTIVENKKKNKKRDPVDYADNLLDGIDEVMVKMKELKEEDQNMIDHADSLL